MLSTVQLWGGESSTGGGGPRDQTANEVHRGVMTQSLTLPSRTQQRLDREASALALATDQDGVASRSQLEAIGVNRHHIRWEVEAKRWGIEGKQTVSIPAANLCQRGIYRSTLFELGPSSALDGVAGLHAAGLSGFEIDQIDVSIPHAQHRRALTGVRVHRRRTMPKVIDVGIRRVHPAVALVNAGNWAVSDRQAATVLAMTLQQGIVAPEHLQMAWQSAKRGERHEFLTQIIQDACDGARSLSELDFVALCRRYGVPVPDRQVVRTSPDGRIYLDVCWTELGLVVEIDGGHHGLALQPVDDSLRQNEVTLAGDKVLRIPVVGLRLYEAKFMDQVVRAVIMLSARHPASA